MLSSVESNLALENDFVVLVLQMVVKFLPAFTMFRDVVIHHIPQQYSNKMARKYDVVMIICKIGQKVYFRTLVLFSQYFTNLIHHLVRFLTLTLHNQNDWQLNLYMVKNLQHNFNGKLKTLRDLVKSLAYAKQHSLSHSQHPRFGKT